MRDETVLTLPGQAESEAAPRPAHVTDSTTRTTLDDARQRFPVNVAANFVWITLNAATNLWYVPYLIGHLGVGTYGLVPLAGMITSYMTILTTGLNGAISRFLSIDLARRDTGAANRTFNTAIVSSFIGLAILTPVAIVAAWFAPRLFNIPVGFEQDARWLVLLTAVAFLVTTFGSTFAVPSYALHRFDLRLLVNIARLAASTALIVLLFELMSPSLWQIGVGSVVSALLFMAGHQALTRRLTPQLKLALNQYDLSRLRQFFGFSGWMLINQIGARLFLSIDLIVANLVFGAEVAGRYGSVTIFSAYLRTLVATVDGVLTPITLTLYARNDPDALVRFARLAVKLAGLAVALPVGLLCGLARPLLVVWLGPDFADLSGLLVALMCHLCINLAVVPLFSLQVATNRVRTPGIVTIAMGILNACLAFGIALWGGWGYMGIAVAGGIVLTLKNSLFTPLHSAAALKRPWWTFLPSMLAGTLGCLAIGVVTYCISMAWPITGWGRLALVCAIASVIYTVAAYFWGLSPSQRRLLRSEIQRRMLHRSGNHRGIKR